MDSLKRLLIGGALAAIWLFVCSFSTPSPLAAETGTIAASASLPDLAVTALTVSPAIPSAGDVMTISVTVQNIGGTASTSCTLACFIDEQPLATNLLDSLSAGDTTTVTFNWKAQAGSHVVRVVADSGNQVTESNKDNNSKSLAFSVSAPDLAIASIAWTPTSPAMGDNVTFNVIVTNIGNQRANSCQLDFTIDGASRGYRTLLPLDPGATISETYVWYALSGNHTIGATADVLQHLYDSNRANNHMEVMFVTALPDLIISAIAIQPDDPTIQLQDLIAGEYVDINVFVQNRGTGLAPPSQVACYIDDSLLGSTWIGYLKPGVSDNSTFLWRTDGNPHIIKAVADVTNIVQESDEMNNTKTVPSPNVLPDLTISSITWDPSPPIVNQPVTFTITVTNQGKAMSPQTDIEYGFGTVYQFTSAISELDIGASTNISIMYTPSQPTFTINAVVDLNKKIAESDKSNNSLVVTVNAIIQIPADLVVAGLTLTPASPLPRQPATLTLIAKNQGKGDAGASFTAIYLDDNQIATVYIDPLAAGATESKDIPISLDNLPDKSSHTLRAVMDSTNIVPEVNQFNKSKEITFSLAMSNLAVQGITWTPLNPNQGDVVTFNIVVVNNGAVLSTSTTVSYYIDGTYAGQHIIDSITPGGTVTNQFTWQVQKVPFNFTATIDQSNSSKSVTIPAPDLLIDSITWLPDAPKELDQVIFTVSISNRGKGPAPATLLYFYIDGASPMTVKTPEISPGANVTVTFPNNFMSGEHTLMFVPNGDGAVVESDLTNNTKTIKLTIQPLPTAKAATGNTTTLTASATPAKTTVPNTKTATTTTPTTSKSANNKSTAGASASPSSRQSILMNKWLIIGFAALGIGAIALLLLLRKKSASNKPAANKRAANKPAANKPAANKPAASKPAATKTDKK